ncbi:hypothetical protein K7G98_07950 [Saccharothrix sp. MB29]|nr:hypothetical protein [Saccharothrix sp. MB29]
MQAHRLPAGVVGQQSGLLVQRVGPVGVGGQVRHPPGAHQGDELALDVPGGRAQLARQVQVLGRRGQVAGAARDLGEGLVHERGELRQVRVREVQGVPRLRVGLGVPAAGGQHERPHGPDDRLGRSRPDPCRRLVQVGQRLRQPDLPEQPQRPRHEHPDQWVAPVLGEPPVGLGARGVARLLGERGQVGVQVRQQVRRVVGGEHRGLHGVLLRLGRPPDHDQQRHAGGAQHGLVGGVGAHQGLLDVPPRLVPATQPRQDVRAGGDEGGPHRPVVQGEGLGQQLHGPFPLAEQVHDLREVQQRLRALGGGHHVEGCFEHGARGRQVAVRGQQHAPVVQVLPGAHRAARSVSVAVGEPARERA